jgi:quercetin dioxygenase-like cupin family protein
MSCPGSPRGYLASMDRDAQHSNETGFVSDRTPRPLDGRSLGFAIGHELNVLRDERPYREHGHNARTLLKNDAFRTVLVVLKPGARVQEHETYHHVALHCIEGRVRVQLPEGPIELPAGGLLGLGPSVPHDVEALEDSAFLLYLGWSEE